MKIYVPIVCGFPTIGNHLWDNKYNISILI